MLEYSFWETSSNSPKNIGKGKTPPPYEANNEINFLFFNFLKHLGLTISEEGHILPVLKELYEHVAFFDSMT